MSLTLRNTKGSKLTFTEMDDNFTYLEQLSEQRLTTSSFNVFTGSASITGSFTGSFVGDGSGLTGVVHGTGSTNYLPIWEDNTTIISSSISSTVNNSGTVLTRFNNADRIIIDKNSDITSGDPAFNISQDGASKVEFGWDDDGDGFGFMYNYSGEGLKFGTAGANPIMFLKPNSAEITGDVEITGSLTVSSSSAIVDFTNTIAVSGSIFSGSFVGDGSGLTGITGVTADSVAFNNITGKPTLVSSSIQVDHNQTTNYNANEHFTQANITTVGTVTTGDISSILPTSDLVRNTTDTYTGTDKITQIITLSQSEYNAISTKSDATLYIIL